MDSAEHPREESTTSLGTLLLRVLAVLFAALVISYYVSLRVPITWQLLTSGALLVLAIFISRLRPDMRLFLMLLSSTVSLRYIIWRMTDTLNFGTIPDLVLGLTLFLAEAYGITIQLLGFFQTVEELHRRPVPLPADPSKLPWVDVFIPTYNEGTDIVGRTATAALLMDYPKKRVYILDDGRRPEMQALAEEIGCGYLTRPNNRHAKAGNLNAALRRTNGELVAVFDADHVPVRSFLQMTVGFFLQDEKVALVQTPHHFFNPDPFQRNLITRDRVPAEQDLFYHVILVGDDFWNSAFFCGSSALLRRSALEEIGGIAHETVTEDAHTALKLHARGWKSAYLAIPQAAGLATDRYAFHIRQRMRWAQGMIQILRLDNPLFKRGLSIAQRLNYFNAAIHFLFGFPRLVYVIAPLTYLLFGFRPIRGDPIDIMAYAFPHIGLAWITNSLTFRGFRHSFWAEVYEMAIAWSNTVVTFKTMLFPRKAKFAVTTKGEGLLGRPEFDWRNSYVNIILIVFSTIGLLAGPRIYLAKPAELNTILLNTVWVLFNLVILVPAVLVALEQRQRRRAHRVRRNLNAVIELDDGRWVPARTVDISESGCRLRIPGLDRGREVRRLRIFGVHGTQVELDVRPRYQRYEKNAMEMGLYFGSVDDEQHRALIQTIYSPADSWIDFRAPRDSIVLSFLEVLTTPFRVIGALYRISVSRSKR